MSHKILNKNGDWLVQVQRAGKRRTKRGTGGVAEAKRVEAQLVAELEQEQKLDEAARMLGIDRTATPAPATQGGRATVAAVAPSTAPTLLDFFEKRWVPHANVVQNASTRRISRSHFNYLLYYLGEKRLDELLRPSEINTFVETMKTRGGLSFHPKKDGTPRRGQGQELCNESINKTLTCLRALLNLAHREEVIATAPKIDLLPTDDSVPVIPPSEEQFQQLLAACEGFREIAPLMPEVVEFTADTGLRRAEVFNLTFKSVDIERAAIRVEMQPRARVVNGRAWKPKHNKWREVPLSTRAKAIVVERRAAGTAGVDDLVFPNRGGAPYVRMDHAPDAAGKGWFPDVVEAAGLRGKVTFHGLRHLFAVRLLTRGVPITVVSELLGHSDINLTVKRYGRFSSDAKVKWDAVKVLDSLTRPPTKVKSLAVK